MSNIELCKLKTRFAALKAKHQVREGLKNSENYIRENPLLSIAIAAGSGLILGKILANRKSAGKK